MLSIGEFSNICRVSTKTLRYYAEIGLLLPSEVNPENGYRYYAIEQLETMLFINRLKAYHFSLDEIGDIFKSDSLEEQLYTALSKKKQELEWQVQNTHNTLLQINTDMKALMQGESIMSFMEDMDVTLVDVPMMYLLSARKDVLKNDYETEYIKCFGQLFRKIANEKLTLAAPPMVLFHGSEHTPQGLDTEFAVSVKEYVTGTRDFMAGLCLKTVVKGSYSNLPSAYVRLREYAEQESYVCSTALFEVYVTDPSQTESEHELITEVYYPVNKSQTERNTL